MKTQNNPTYREIAEREIAELKPTALVSWVREVAEVEIRERQPDGAPIKYEDVDALVMNDYLRLSEIAVQRQLAARTEYAQRREVEAAEREAQARLDFTCPICHEYVPGVIPVERRVGEPSTGRSMVSCLSCFVTAERLFADAAVTPARVASVRSYLG